MLRFEAVGLRYPGAARPALDEVSLDVARGELLVLLGPSGCGKTSLLKTVNRLVEPTAGRVLLDGADVREREVTALRRGIGYVIQATGLFPHLTVAQNIALVPGLLGWPPGRIAARVAELLELVQLPADLAPRRPRQLSGGEAQRVGIARALAADPAHLLMDEPFGALDAITRGHLQQALLGIQARLPRTILFVTHDVDEALCLADRIAVLRTGRLVQVGAPLELLTRPADPFVRELLGGGDVFRRLGQTRVGDVMEPPDAAAPPRDEPPLEEADDLRRALAALLDAGADALPVRGPGGEVTGRLTMAALRRFSRLRPAP